MILHPEPVCSGLTEPQKEFNFLLQPSMCLECKISLVQRRLRFDLILGSLSLQQTGSLLVLMSNTVTTDFFGKIFLKATVCVRKNLVSMRNIS